VAMQAIKFGALAAGFVSHRAANLSPGVGRKPSQPSVCGNYLFHTSMP
jgi:hypothetical protein